MMHIRSRRILAAVSVAALLFTSVPSGALAGEPEYGEALLVMQEEEVPEESAELQEADIPGSPEESAAGEADVLVTDGEDLSSDDQELVEIEDLLVNEEEEDPEIMVVEDGIPEEDEEQVLTGEEEILSDEEEILEAADGEEAPSVRIEIFNAEPDDKGVYRGKYSYIGNVIVTGTESDEIWVGWGDFEDTVPDGSELQSLESWHDYKVDDEGVQTASLWASPDEREDVWEDSLFLRLSEDEEWQKYSFVYDMNGEAAPAPVITSDDDLEYGEPYTVAWKPVDGAAYYLLWWKFPNGLSIPKQIGGNETSCEVFDDYDMDWTSAYGEYEFWVESWVPGFAPAESEHVKKTIEAPEQSDDISFWAEGLEPDDENELTAMLYGHIEFKVEAPGADYVRFFDGRRSEQYWLDDEGYTQFGWNPDEEEVEEYVVYVQAYDSDDVLMGYRSLSFKVLTDSRIEDSITFRVTNEADDQGNIVVPRDGLVTLEVDPVSGVDFYCAYIDSEYGRADSHWVEANADGKTFISFPVAQIEADHEYQVRVYAIKVGAPRKDAENAADIYVGQRDSISDVIISMKDTYQVSEPLRIAAYFDNQDDLDENRLFMEVRIYEKTDYENEYWDEDWYDNRQGTDFRDDGYSISQSGDYVLTATVYQNVEDEEPEEIARAVHEFTVYAENGDLTVDYDPGIPAFFPEQEGYELTIPFPDEQVEWMNVKISEETDHGWDSICEDWRDYTEDHTFTFDTWEGQFINVEIWLHARGYNEKYIREEHIPVLLAEPSDQVCLTVKEFDEDSDEDKELTIPVNKGFDVTLTAEKPIQAIRVDAGDHWWYERDEFGPDNWYDSWYENGNRIMHDTSGGYRRPGTYRFYAQVLLEDSEDWITSNVIQITAQQFGEVGPFKITMEPDTVIRGEDVTVTFTEAEYAEEYWPNLWHDGEEEWDYDWSWDWAGDWTDGKRTAVLHTVGLPAGEYLISAEAAAEGRLGYCTDDRGRPALKLIVEDYPEEDLPASGILLQTDKTEIVTEEQVNISAYAPGAEWIEVYYDWPDEGWRTNSWGRDYIQDRQGYGRAGTYYLMARAWYPVLDDNGELLCETDENGEICYERDEDDNLLLDDDGNPRPMYQYYYRDSETITLTVAADSTLNPITLAEPVLPASLTAGRDLNFTITKPENAQRGHVFVNVDDWDDEDNLFSREFDYEDEQQTGIPVFLSWDELSDRGIHAGDSININVQAGAYGREGLDRNWKIPVVKEADEDVFISVEDESMVGEDGVINALVNQNVDLTVTASEGHEIQTVRFFGGYDFWDDEDPDEDGVFHAGPSYWEEGIYSVFAMVTFDSWPEDYEGEGDPRTWVYTDTLKIRTVKKGDVGSFTISLDQQEVNRGDKVKVTFTPAEYAEDYWIHDDYDWYWEDEENRIAVINTLGMGEGEYWIRGRASADGYEGRDSSAVKLTVKPMEDVSEGDVILLTQEDTVALSQRLHTGVYAPGALRVGFLLDGEPWHLDEDGNYCWGDGDCWTSYEDIWWEDAWEAGEHTLQGCAQFEEDGEWSYSDIQKVTVTCKGILEFDRSTLPANITAGSGDVSVTVKLPENAAAMNIQLHEDYRVDPEDEEDDGWRRDEIDEWFDLTEDKVITIPAENLTAGHQIRIDFQAWAIGYGRAEDGQTIPVTPQTGEGAVLVLDEEEGGFTPTEGEEGAYDVLVNQNIVFRVRPAAEDQKLAAVRFFDGYGYWEEGKAMQPDLDEYDYCFDENDHFFSIQRYGESETRRVFAEVLLEGSEEWFTTNAITIHAKATGKTGTYDFDFTRMDHEITVQRGDPVTLFFTESEYADNYWADAFSDDEEWRSFNPRCSCSGTTVTMLTVNLPAGEYVVFGRAGNNAPGWQWTESDSNIRLTVTEPEDDDIRVIVDSTELMTHENLTISVLAPGAKRIGIAQDGWRHDLQDGDGEYQWDDTGDNWSGDFISWDNPGTYEVIAYAQYEDDGDWVSSDPVKITVLADGHVALDTSQIPFSVPAGQEVSFTVPWPEGDGVQYLGYDISVQPSSEGGAEYHIKRSDNTEGDAEISFTTGTVEYEDGEETKNYTIQVGDVIHLDLWAGGLGYEHLHIDLNIPVVNEAADTVSLSAVDEYGESLLANGTVSIVPNKQVRFIVSPGEGHTLTAVKFFDGYGYRENGDAIVREDERYYEDGRFFAWQGYGDPGQKTVFAMALLDDSEEWVSTNQIDVTVTSAGPAEPRDVTVPGYNLVREDTVITVEDPGEAWYHLSISTDQGGYWHNVLDYQYGDNRTDNNDGKIFLEGDAIAFSGQSDGGRPYGDLTLTIPAGVLDAGTYELNVDFAAEGFENNSVHRIFQIVEEPSVTLSTQKSRYTYGDAIELTITAPFADSVVLKKAGSDGEEDETLETWYASDPDVDVEHIAYSWIADEVRNDVTFYVEATFFDGSENCNDEVTLRIKSLGPAPEPTVIVPETLDEGEDLNVKFTDIPDGVSCNVEIYCQGDDSPLLSGSTEFDNLFTLAYTQAEIYRVTVEYGISGYDDGCLEYEVVVNHVYQAEFTWNDDGDDPSCTAEITCAKCLDINDTINEEDIEIRETERTEPTCKKAGSVTYTALVEYEEQTFENSKVYVLAATGHTPENMDAEEPTCTEPGYTAGTVCEVCGEILSGREVIPAQGHSWNDWTIEVDYEDNSADAVRYCDNCDEEIREEAAVTIETTAEPTCTADGEITYTAAYEPDDGKPLSETWTETISKLGHEWSKFEPDPERPATCDKAGWSISTCSRCGRKRDKNIPKLGHNWGEVTYTWAKDNSTVTATRVCANDKAHEHDETETAKVTSEVTIPATCDTIGKTTYTSKAFTNPAFQVQTKTLEDVSALGHAWGEVTYTWAEDNSTVTATRICANNSDHKETETVDVTGEVTTPATYTQMGKTTYTSADFTNQAFEQQTRTETDVPKKSASDTADENLAWSISDDGTLTISVADGAATGATKDEYTDEDPAPWIEAAKALGVTKIVVAEGVTKIGSNAFAGLDNVEDVSLPKSLEEISPTAFDDKTVSEASFSFAGTNEQWKSMTEGTALADKDVSTVHEHTWSEWKTVSKATIFKAEQQKRTCSGCGKSETRSNGKKLRATIRLSAISGQIAAGKKVQIAAQILPGNVKNYPLRWTSSNTSVATVSATGLVSVNKKAGGKSVVITAIAVKKIKISGKKTAKAGKSVKLKAKVTTTKGKANKKLQWTSSNTAWATVAANGKVTTKAAGKGKKVTITAMATDGSGKKKTFKIKIK